MGVECRPEFMKNDRQSHGEHVAPAKIMFHISMETGLATQSPVAEVEPCSTSAFWSRQPPATPRNSPETGRGAVAGRRSLRFWYCESAGGVRTKVRVYTVENILVAEI